MIGSTAPKCRLLHSTLAGLLLLLATTPLGRAAIPAPEKVLPDDTLVLVTAPDFNKLREVWKQTPLSRFWNDPAMRPFKEHFLSKWTESVVQPVERELGLKLADYADLLEGQVTFAVLQNGWQGGDDPAPGVVLLVDAKDKKDQLTQHLADFRKKWVESGKALRTQKIRDVEFTVLSVASNDAPKTLNTWFPPASEEPEAGDDPPPKKAPAKQEWVFGQVDSLLVTGNSTKAVERIVLRLTGGTIPPLAELAAYQANHLALFRDAPLYGWVNAKAVIDILSHQTAEKKENSDAPNPFDISPAKLMNALGLASLKTVALSFQNSEQGALFAGFLGVPESDRQGVFKILAGEPKESNPPSFVPADALKFQRWRIDGQKTWAALEHMAGDISPQWLAGINFLLDTANAAAKEKDPTFDVKKNLIGNLGDDIITYEKPARGKSTGEMTAPPSIFLLGSPRPEELALALKSLLVLVGQQSGAPPEEREFLGRKIYSVPLRAIGLPMGATPVSGAPARLNYAASGGYVAFSTDAATLEEFLRTSDSQGKMLRETPGFGEAAQKVLGPGASLFGFENQAELLRGWFEILRTNPALATNSTASSVAGMLPIPAIGLKDWFDFSLLPPFDQVSKYFYFSVYGGGATVDGLAFKMFMPLPPGASRTPEAASGGTR